MNNLPKLQIQNDKIEYVFNDKIYVVNVINTNNKRMYLTLNGGEFFLRKPINFSERVAINFVNAKIYKLILKREFQRILKIQDFINIDAGWFFMFGKKENFYIRQDGLDFFMIGNNFKIKINSLNKYEIEQEIKQFILPLFLEKAKAMTKRVEQQMQAVSHEVKVNENKTNWGTNAIGARIISYNFTLAHFADKYLEYIAIHEVTHSFETNHTPRFRAILKRYCPNWKELDKKLNGRIVY